MGFLITRIYYSLLYNVYKLIHGALRNIGDVAVWRFPIGEYINTYQAIKACIGLYHYQGLRDSYSDIYRPTIFVFMPIWVVCHVLKLCVLSTILVSSTVAFCSHYIRFQCSMWLVHCYWIQCIVILWTESWSQYRTTTTQWVYPYCMTTLVIIMPQLYHNHDFKFNLWSYISCQSSSNSSTIHWWNICKCRWMDNLNGRTAL